MAFFRNTDEHLAYLKRKHEEFLASQNVAETTTEETSVEATESTEATATPEVVVKTKKTSDKKKKK